MITNAKMKISTLAKELNLKTKELQELLTKAGVEGKTHSTSLEPDEYGIVMEYLSTQNATISNMDAYISGSARITLQKAKEAEVSAAPAKEDAVQADKALSASVKNAKAQPAAASEKTADQPEQNAAESGKPGASASADTTAASQSGAGAAAEAKKEGSSDASAAPKRTDAVRTPGKPNVIHPDNRAQGQNRFDKKPNFGASVKNGKNEQHTQKPARQQPVPVQTLKPRPVQPVSEKPVTISSDAISDTRGGKQGARVVDTRTTSVDLSKYDDKLVNMVPSDSDRKFDGGTQKLKKQNNGNKSGAPMQGGRNGGKQQQGSSWNNRDGRMGKNGKKQPFGQKKPQEPVKKQPLQVSIPDELTVSELAQKLKASGAEVIKRLMMLGVMATLNQTVDFDTASLSAEELGAKVTKEVTVTIEEKLFDETEDKPEDLVPRAPVVCVMGHVDHGKTSILDAIRHTNVTQGEAGGITQHIGAYRVNVNGQDITFLDTPGHEAFTAMRARGAMATDIAILVVAADDGIMPQTIEAINHAKAAGLDIVVAINKMDKPGAQPENIKQQLTQYGLVPEDWGGDVICCPVSALTKKGIDNLLESVLLVAEMKDLKANPNRKAKGIVIEARLDKGRGPVATVLVQNGTLHSGDIVIAGTAVGRVRAMTNDKGKAVKAVYPSEPVEIVGLSEVPVSGDSFAAVDDERMAREYAEQRKARAKEEEFSANSRVNLDDLFAQINDGAKELNVIIKADVVGSSEAVKQALLKLSNDQVKVHIVHAAVGGITESDVMLASVSNAIIIGFNVRPDKSAMDAAERQKVDIRTYRIIYDCINEITAAMKGMLAPSFKENIIGHVQVRQTIHVPNVGTIAGAYVMDGKVTRKSKIRILRDSVVIAEDNISSLRRFKDDVKEVAAGFECGIGLEKFNDMKENDIFEVFEMVEVAQ